MIDATLNSPNSCRSRLATRSGKKMASLTVKGIPDDVLAGMRRNAELNRRSLNSEAIVAFERAIGLDPEAILTQVRAARAQMAGVQLLSPEEIEQAINVGRP